MFHNIALSGGGAHALSFIGALRVYEERGLLQAVKGIATSSAGAIVGLMLALGFSTEEMVRFVDKLDDTHFVVGVSWKHLWNMHTTFGLDDGESLLELADAIFEEKKMPRSTTFLELAKAKGRHLIVAAANVSRERVVYMSVDNWPDLPIRNAIRMTTSVPLMYCPVIHDGEYYVDALFYDNFPIRCFAMQGANTLGLRVVHRCERIATMWDFFQKLVTGSIDWQCEGREGREGREGLRSVCHIDCQSVTNFDIARMRFAFDKESARRLYIIGETAARSHLDHAGAAEPSTD